MLLCQKIRYCYLLFPSEKMFPVCWLDSKEWSAHRNLFSVPVACLLLFLGIGKTQFKFTKESTGKKIISFIHIPVFCKIWMWSYGLRLIGINFEFKYSELRTGEWRCYTFIFSVVLVSSSFFLKASTISASSPRASSFSFEITMCLHPTHIHTIANNGYIHLFNFTQKMRENQICTISTSKKASTDADTTEYTLKVDSNASFHAAL